MHFFFCDYTTQRNKCYNYLTTSEIMNTSRITRTSITRTALVIEILDYPNISSIIRTRLVYAKSFYITYFNQYNYKLKKSTFEWRFSNIFANEGPLLHNLAIINHPRLSKYLEHLINSLLH